MMPHLTRRSITSIFFIILFSASVIAQQTQGRVMKGEERIVEKTTRKPTPLKVKIIKTKKGEVLLGEKFVEGDNWFQGLSVVLENISGKTVIYVGAGFIFPRQSDEVGKAPPLYMSLLYGHHPSAPNGTYVDVPPLTLKPGERITVALSDSDYAQATTRLRRLEYPPSIKTIKFHLAEIYFDDGTGWVAGNWLRRDPDNPEDYIRDPQPNNIAPGNPSILFNHRLRNLTEFSNTKILKASWPQTCTVQTEPPQGEIGRCGIYNGFYSRRCCSSEFPTLTNCYKREAWIRPGYLGEEFDTTVYEVNDFCRLQLGLGDTCLIKPNRIHFSCEASGCSDCAPGERCIQGRCQPDSPVIIDVSGNGIRLTDAVNGVNFDLDGDDISERLAWTTTNSDDGWLFFDRNHNGTVDDGRELFGNFTPQPRVNNPNGFLALAEFDKFVNGGNREGIIDNRDAVFASLQLWQDVNHNGISETGELRALNYFDVLAIDLDYRESRRRDEYGNQFRYRARVYDRPGASIGRWAWDVFLVHAP